MYPKTRCCEYEPGTLLYAVTLRTSRYRTSWRTSCTRTERTWTWKWYFFIGKPNRVHSKLKMWCEAEPHQNEATAHFASHSPYTIKTPNIHHPLTIPMNTSRLACNFYVINDMNQSVKSMQNKNKKPKSIDEIQSKLHWINWRLKLRLNSK